MIRKTSTGIHTHIHKSPRPPLYGSQGQLHIISSLPLWGRTKIFKSPKPKKYDDLELLGHHKMQLKSGLSDRAQSNNLIPGNPAKNRLHTQGDKQFKVQPSQQDYGIKCEKCDFKSKTYMTRVLES